MTTAQNRSPRYNELSGMEITGFVVFSASSDGADINSEVKRSLHLWPKIEKAPLVYGRGDADTCARFLRRGTEESDAFTRKIKEAIGEGTRLTHPSRPAVSVFRDLSNIDEIRVTFMLYSQDLTKEETRESQPVKRKLRPNEILFVKGSVRMEIEVPARGSFVWQGNTGALMGPDMYGPEVFEFMTV
ncbi:unnamed protein product [Penicillium nalgiovense]|nr:unnamed protein product [Penicillium nalgiovense]